MYYFFNITLTLGTVNFKCVVKSDVLQTVALNVPRYAATLASYILITQACSDFYNLSSLSYHGNITYDKSVPYKLNETSETTQGR